MTSDVVLLELINLSYDDYYYAAWPCGSSLDLFLFYIHCDGDRKLRKAKLWEFDFPPSPGEITSEAIGLFFRGGVCHSQQAAYDLHWL